MDNIHDLPFGQMLKHYRKRIPYTQEEFGQQPYIGLSTPGVQKYEQGKRGSIPLDRLNDMARVLRLSEVERNAFIAAAVSWNLQHEHATIRRAIAKVQHRTDADPVGESGLDVQMLLKLIHYRRIADGITRVKWSERETKIDNLLEHLASETMSPTAFREPQPVTVTGILNPMALMSAGWWAGGANPEVGRAPARPAERSGSLKRWLRYGFDVWAPSINLHWNFDKTSDDDYLIAQLGSNDEGNTLPVVIHATKAEELELHEKFRAAGDARGLELSGFHAAVSADLCHRNFAPDSLKQHFGLNLDYFLLIHPDQDKHTIVQLNHEDDVFSGYLWQCVAPASAVLADDETIGLHQVYFVWEHSNFLDGESVQYNLQSLKQKNSYISSTFENNEDLIVIQKSSQLVPGDVPKLWTPARFANLLRMYSPSSEA